MRSALYFTYARLHPLCMRLIAGGALLGLLTACVTETTGGIPGPAPKEDRVQAQLGLARGYLEEGDLTRAKPALNRALKIDPRHVEAHVLSGVLFAAESEYEVAEEHYRAALHAEPDNAQALNNYGSFLYSVGRYDDALQPLSRLVKDTSYRARPQAFENLGLVYLKLDETDAAKKAFERAVDLNFRQVRSSLELAELAYEAGDYDTAYERFRTYNSLARPSAQSLCLGLKLSQVKGEADEVASYGMALKNLYPKQAERCRAKS